MAKRNPHTGSNFDDFLKEEKLFGAVHAKARKRALAVVSPQKRSKYTLKQLLAQCKGKKFRIDKAWNRAAPVGKEVI